MLRVLLVSFFTAATLSAQVPTAQTLLSRAAQAMGGTAALDALRNKTVEFNSATFALGQEETAESPARATMTFGRIVTDYAGTRQFTTQTARAVNGTVTQLRRVTLPTMSMAETNGTLTMDGGGFPANLARNQSLQIEQVIRAGVHHADAARLVPLRQLRGEAVRGVRLFLGPDTVSVYFDQTTGLPFATETVTDDGVLGDRRTLTWYTRWQDAGGVMLPRQVDVEWNGRLQSHVVFTSAAITQELDQAQFAIPDSMAQRAPRLPAAPPPLTVTLVNLAPGVWRAEGSTHHSLVVEQGNGLLVIEAPQSAVRSNAVLDTLRSRFPGKPVTGVVMTHHHYDHSGGIRAYQARGIRVIGHQRNAGFVRRVGTAPKTVAPDRISRGAVAPPFIPVRDSLSLGSGAGHVVLYRLASSHAEGLLGAWVPSAGIVFTSDVVSPAANQAPPRLGSTELVAFARKFGIAPSKYVGGHGVVVDWSVVVAAGS